MMINDKADEVIGKLFKSLIKNYQVGLEKSMRGSDFILDCIHLLYYKRQLYYKCHNINANRGESYTDSPGWIKNKKAC